MIWNFFKVAYRNLLHNKGISAINITGLAVGMASAMLIFLWLMDYTYRVSISWWVFALAGFLSVMIALLTVSYQSIRAAIANPAKSLRTE